MNFAELIFTSDLFTVSIALLIFAIGLIDGELYDTKLRFLLCFYSLVHNLTHGES